MKKPCLDRIDVDHHYELSNCRFLENGDNISIGGRMRVLMKKDNKETKSCRVRKYLLDKAHEVAKKEFRSVTAIIERALIKELFPPRGR